MVEVEGIAPSSWNPAQAASTRVSGSLFLASTVPNRQGPVSASPSKS